MMRWVCLVGFLLLGGYGCIASPYAAQCMTLCAHLAQLGCPEAQPRTDGTSCQSTCIHLSTEGLDLRVSCVIKQQQCEDIAQACPVKNAIAP